MKFDFTGLSIAAVTEEEKKAAEILKDEINTRTGHAPAVSEKAEGKAVVFKTDNEGEVPHKDSYKLSLCGETLYIIAKGIRGFIFGIGYFLRKTEYKNEKITLIKDISGLYVPDKRIRGHQLGYRTTPNTYDAWTYDDYVRYYKDMMFFGCNMCEHIPYEKAVSNRNHLMKYDEEEFLIEASRLADELDLDVSIWFPNCEDTLEEAVERRRELFKKIPRINAVFPPGGDPGDLEAEEFVRRAIAFGKVLKEFHPNAGMWPSAQKPKKILSWGDDFIEEMEKLPDEIEGIVTGPNRAFPLHELRRLLPTKYPIRLYTDITHNVRCEYPVHYPYDDWHYSLTSCLSRESVNPRPAEYEMIHRLTRGYIVGSVSYSEGVNDDLNKMVWSNLDFFPNVSIRETIEDYARLFFPGAPADLVTEGFLGFEHNWMGDPVNNPGIEATLKIWQGLASDYPKLMDNWRFVMHLFRAECDAIVRRRRIFELNLIDDALYVLNKEGLEAALKVLEETEFDDEYKSLREHIEVLAEKLFNLIGMQLDVARYGANSWERGATLETIDLPVTDREWLIGRFKHALTLPESERDGFVHRVINRNKVGPEEFYYSFAEHGFDMLGVRQEGEVYINFQGDRPENRGKMPMSMLKVFDNLTFRCKLGGFAENTDYKLRITFKSDKHPIFNRHYIIANGVEIYKGPQFGGERDEKFDEELLAPGFETATYLLPASVFKNGTLELEFGEPLMGVMMCEFWITKA